MRKLKLKGPKCYICTFIRSRIYLILQNLSLQASDKKKPDTRSHSHTNSLLVSSINQKKNGSCVDNSLANSIIITIADKNNQTVLRISLKNSANS